MLVCWPVAKTRVPLTGEEGMLCVPALIFSLAWAASRRAATSFIGFQISEPRAVATAPGPPPPLRVKERGGGVAWQRQASLHPVVSLSRRIMSSARRSTAQTRRG